MVEVPIRSLHVDTYRVPTDGPEQDGTFRWDATEMLVVRVRAGGCEGLGYSYTAARAAAALVHDKLEPLVLGESALNIGRLWARLNDSLRNLGRPGLGMMAISAVDQALWDLKARLLNVSLLDLWGRMRDAVPAYGSGGFINYSDQQLISQVQHWREQRLDSIKIKLGGDPCEAQRRVALAADHAAGAALMVDLNGACHPRAALAVARRIEPYEVVWLEEPVSSDDLAGMAWLRDRAPGHTAIAAGEYGWGVDYFQRMLAAGAVDVLQADATRCGYSGFLQAAALCEAMGVSLSAHCAPAIHVPVCSAVPGLLHLEYFHDHVRLESMLFDTGTTLREGRLWPDQQRVGHGLVFRDADAERYRL